MFECEENPIRSCSLRLGATIAVFSILLTASCVSESSVPAKNHEVSRRCDAAREWFQTRWQKHDGYKQIPTQSRIADEPYIRGKLLVLSSRFGGKTFNPHGVFLPEECRTSNSQFKFGADDPLNDIRAQSDEEVQTVAFVACQFQAGGEYARPGSTYTMTGAEETCTLMIVDRAIDAVIHVKGFRSESLAPVENVAPGTGGPSKNVDLAIVDQYLARLPRK